MKQRLYGLCLWWLMGGWITVVACGAWASEESPSHVPSEKTPVIKEATPAAPTPALSGQGSMVLIPPRPALEQYRVITDRNMFQRRTANPRPGPGNATAAPAPVNPAAMWLLSGTVTVGTQQVAFFENTQSHQTLRVMLNENMPAGRVVVIHHDRVEMEVDGRRRVVELGQRVDPSAVAANGSTVGGEPTVTPTGEMSLLERMRARRQQELNR